MARPKKPGLSYFPFECDFFHDRKIRNLRGRYGCDGICVYQYLLCEIYADNGYYIVWDEDLEDAIITDLGLKDNFITQVLNYLCNRSLFNDTLFTSVKILTSESIQRRYQSAKGANSNSVSVDADIWLLNEKETLSCIKVTQKTDLSEKNGSFSAVNTCLTEENALKESKVNKSKVNKSRGSKPTKRFVPPTLEEVKAYCNERQNNIDAEHFIDTYKANGWMMGSNPMDDWRAAVRKWEKNGFAPKRRSGQISRQPSYNLEQIKRDAMMNTDIKIR